MPLEYQVLFLGFLLGDANVERRGDSQDKKLFIDTAEALIPSGDIHFLENLQVFSNPTPIYSFFKKM